MRVDLLGMVIVVTGAASGIGAAVARLAASSGAAGLVLTDRNANGMTELAAALDSETLAVTADLSDPDAPSRIIGAAQDRFGRIDGLVNAAGLTDRASFAGATPEIWERLFAVNARAPFFLMQGALADMTARGTGGAIVNILSVNAHCGTPELSVYAATKGALLTLTKNAANTHAGNGIRVNGINLGWVLTETEDRMQSVTLGRGPGWAAEEAARLPLGRLLGPDEAARLAVYLLSPASSPMTGCAIDLDQTILVAP
ncbi:MAG: SDR family oxidoreductase [Paracoccaceae bacterium]